MARREKLFGVMVAIAGSGLLLSACAGSVRSPIVGGGIVFDASMIERRSASTTDFAVATTSEPAAVDFVLSPDSGALTAVDFTAAATKLSHALAAQEQAASRAQAYDFSACDTQ